jgi:hypothetical protein
MALRLKIKVILVDTRMLLRCAYRGSNQDPSGTTPQLSRYWSDILGVFDVLLATVKEAHVPRVLVQALFRQLFSFVNVQLFNQLLLRRECCSFSNGEYVKTGLAQVSGCQQRLRRSPHHCSSCCNLMSHAHMHWHDQLVCNWNAQFIGKCIPPIVCALCVSPTPTGLVVCTTWHCCTQHAALLISSVAVHCITFALPPLQVENWISEAGQDYVGESWDELKYIRQAVTFLVIGNKPKKSLDEITHDLCPVLSIQQVGRG